MEIDQDLYEVINQDDGNILLKKRVKFERPRAGYGVLFDGLVSEMNSGRCFDFFNIFPTRETAKAHSERIKTLNAIALAVSLVEPDFVPDWRDGHLKYSFARRKDGMHWTCFNNNDPLKPVVSSKEKAGHVLELLDSWGVK